MTSIIKVDTLQTAAGGVPTAADLGLNTAGSIIQVQQATTTTQIEYSSSSTAEFDLGMQVAITPRNSSSRFLISLANYSILTRDAASRAKLWLYRRIDGGTWVKITGIANYIGQGGIQECYPNAMHLDTPSTALTIDYKLVGQRLDGTGNIAFHHDNNDNPDLISSLTVMEIAG